MSKPWIQPSPGTNGAYTKSGTDSNASNISTADPEAIPLSKFEPAPGVTPLPMPPLPYACPNPSELVQFLHHRFQYVAIFPTSSPSSREPREKSMSLPRPVILTRSSSLAPTVFPLPSLAVSATAPSTATSPPPPPPAAPPGLSCNPSLETARSPLAHPLPRCVKFCHAWSSLNYLGVWVLVL